jgi:AmmeMemoRadiSam system protein B
MIRSTRLLFPKLRAVDVRPYRQKGADYYLLRDPLALTDGSLLVPQFFGPLLALCDGTLEDATALASALTVRYGVGIDAETIGEVLTALDEAFMLENERSAEALRGKIEAYRQRPFRAAALAGLSYPAEGQDLARLLDDYLAQTARKNGNGQGRSTRPGIFSPHIDYPRGGTVYAHAWKAMEDAVDGADLAVLIGTDHNGDDLFTLTRQHYATPFGALPTETRIVDSLATALGEDAAYAGELRHVNEHSLELVAVWLHHLRRGRPLAVVPVLVGSLHRFYGKDRSPATHPPVQTFLQTLESHLQGRNVLVVASGDLAHVGPAFGGSPLTAQDRLQVRSADRTLIDHLVAGDAEGFFQAVGAIRNRNNVCGVTPGYLALKLMGAVHGTVHGEEMAYQSCPADERDTSAVTITGVAYC